MIEADGDDSIGADADQQRAATRIEQCRDGLDDRILHRLGGPRLAVGCTGPRTCSTAGSCRGERPLGNLWDEELTVDYGLISDDPTFRMECTCGAPTCRGLITGEDWQIPELRERYAGHWPPGLEHRVEGATQRRL